MKKAVLGLALVLSFGSAAMAQSKGDIRFTGEVLKAACTVAPVSDVRLGSVSTKTLSEAGKTSRWEKSSIEFYDCDTTTGEDDGDALSAVDLSILPGTAHSGSSELWNNIAGTPAANVGLELRIANENVKPEGANLTDLPITKAGTLSVPIQARMKATEKAGEGDFEATVSFEATYK
ncbi:fimbrial protein [Wohlfahrtiimonas larvae]|uniref:Fimbrial-type adhesion domain-containing protein n=1 Tax=Wohlfahrtiimonas larvae TaxID=1157986 RepID=A0ABP9MZS2_9GAMM|nr:fimbrial protein [Wohlfahrtiimonas larvae]